MRSNPHHFVLDVLACKDDRTAGIYQTPASPCTETIGRHSRVSGPDLNLLQRHPKLIRRYLGKSRLVTLTLTVRADQDGDLTIGFNPDRGGFIAQNNIDSLSAYLLGPERRVLDNGCQSDPAIDALAAQSRELPEPYSLPASTSNGVPSCRYRSEASKMRICWPLGV